MNWLQLFVSLSLLIILHEGGHFLAARMFKTRVEKFYLFFDFLFPLPNVLNFSLFKFKKGDTEYGLGWFPLGGYVKIAGMADESQDKDALAGPPQPWEFRSKKAWQRLIIILGGIIVNIVTGILIFWGVKFTYGDHYLSVDKVTVFVNDSVMYNAGVRNGDKLLGYKYFEDFNQAVLFNRTQEVRVERDGKQYTFPIPSVARKIMIRGKKQMLLPRVPFVIAGIADNSPNLAEDIQPGDRIVRFDTVNVKYFDEVREITNRYKGKEVPVVIDRNGTELKKTLRVNDEGYLGFVPLSSIKEIKAQKILPIESVQYGFFEALPVGINACVDIVKNYALSLSLIWDFETEAYREVGGFIGMSKMFSPEFSWEGFWLMTGILSLILAFMNFLPIPMLDGGYMIFILWEMITGKQPNEKFMNIANNVGFFILIALMLYANGNDIVKLFTGGK